MVSRAAGALILALALAGAAPAAVLVDISEGVELKRNGAAVEIGATFAPADVLAAARPCRATFYDDAGVFTIDVAAGLARPVGAAPPGAPLAGAVGKALTGAFAAPLTAPALPAPPGAPPSLDGDPQLPGLPEMDELSRWRRKPGGGFETLDDEKYAKVIGLAAALTEPGAPPGARLALARWLESKGLAYAALFEYRNALRARLAKGKLPAAYHRLARHVAGLALALGDRGTAGAIAAALAR